MKLIDLNLLLYAVNEDSPNHSKAKLWLEEAFASGEFLALPWIVLLGFLRISTHPKILENPLTPSQAMEVVDGWLKQPSTRVLQSGKEHWSVLRALLTDSGTAGNLTTDAHLAALAIEHRCKLCSTDHDFSRFQGLDWENPLHG